MIREGQGPGRLLGNVNKLPGRWPYHYTLDRNPRPLAWARQIAGPLALWFSQSVTVGQLYSAHKVHAIGDEPSGSVTRGLMPYLLVSFFP